MRILIFLALLAVGCSSTDPRTSRSPRPTPRAQALQVNLPGANSGSTSGAGGPGSGPVGAPSGGTGGDAHPGQSSSSQVASSSGQGHQPLISPGLIHMPGYQPSLTVVNPGSSDSGSMARGFQLYRDNCTMCHGSNLKGPELTHSEMPVRDLTLFKQYKFGSTDQALYRTLVYGIPRTAMGNFQNTFTPAQIWDLINYIKSHRAD